MTLNNSKRLLCYVGFLLTLLLAIDLVPAQAVRLSSVQPRAIQLHNTQTKQARGQVPGRRRGGARRGDCPAAPIEITALVPVTEVSTSTLPEAYVGGITTAERPTFWFYVPYSLTTDFSAEFILQDDRGEEVYHLYSADFPPSEQTPGIISVSLPSTIAPLKIGKVYQWYFKLNCKMEAFTYVQGGIERIALNPDLASRLANASPQVQANLYLENGIWYDAVTVLAQSRRTRMNDAAIESAWINLLRSVKLEDIPTN
jgi:hypothetical protein